MEVVVGEVELKDVSNVPPKKKKKKKRKPSPPQTTKTDAGSGLAAELKRLKQDQGHVLALCSVDGTCLQAASPRLRAQHDIVTAAVTESGLSLRYASRDLRATKSVAHAAVKSDAMAIQYASPELRGDLALAEMAIKANPMAMKAIAPRLKGVKSLAVSAVAQKGSALRFCSRDLQADPEVVTIAVKNDGLALNYGRFFSREISRLAAHGCVGRLIFQIRFISTASERCRDDRSVVLAAVLNDPHSIWFASARLQQDLKILEVIASMQPTSESVPGEAARHSGEEDEKDVVEPNAKRVRKAEKDPAKRKDRKTPSNSPNDEWLVGFR